jgi:hypothetical protein
LAGGLPQGQFEQFLGGIGDIFGALSQRYSKGLTPNAPILDQTIQIAKEFNATLDLIRGGLAAILEWDWDERPRLEKSCAESLAKSVLGEVSRFLSLIPEKDVPAKLTSARCLEGSFCFFVPGVESTVGSGDEGELESFREVLIAAERKTEDYLRELVEARRRDLENLRAIATVQSEVSRLTRLTCELKAENQGFRDQLQGDGLPPVIPMEAVDEAERYPVGEGKDPIEWLRSHWGHRLSYFGASQNTLFQDQLRKYDPGLMQAMENRLKYERRKNGAAPRLREIVPTKADRNSQRLATALAGLESNPDLPYVAVYRLQKRFASRR